MKLIFRKNEASEISVTQKDAEAEIAFSYVDMIKELIASPVMEEPEVLGNFTEAERGSIKSMTTFINQAIAANGK